MDAWTLTILAVVLVSFVSLIGIFAFSLKESLLHSLLPSLVGLAAGALLGDAVLHLIPESLEEIGNDVLFGITVLGGIAVFFVLEKYLRWHHAHHADEEEHDDHDCTTHPTHLAPMVLIADGIHNMVDGAVIAGSFLVSPALGVATTVAVFLHEIPQEIADYALLIHSGLSKGRALFFNFLSGLTALVGAFIVLLLGTTLPMVGAYAAAFTAGAFIYIAAADLVPELHRNNHAKQSTVQFIALLLGIGFMVSLVFFE